MKQPRDSLFFQSQLFVAELCEPLTYLEYMEADDGIVQKPNGTKLEKLDHSKDSNSKS